MAIIASISATDQGSYNRKSDDVDVLEGHNYMTETTQQENSATEKPQSSPIMVNFPHLTADRLFLAALFALLSYFHYVRFIQDADLEENEVFRWKYYTWNEFRDLPNLLEDQNLLYLAYFGYVFNVTASPHFYKQGEGGYALFHGREATRALALGSLEESDLDRDLLGLTDMELFEGRDNFEETYLSKYPILGRIYNKELPWNQENVTASDHGRGGEDGESTGTTSSSGFTVPAPENLHLDDEADDQCENLPSNATTDCRERILQIKRGMNRTAELGGEEIVGAAGGAKPAENDADDEKYRSTTRGSNSTSKNPETNANSSKTTTKSGKKKKKKAAGSSTGGSKMPAFMFKPNPFAYDPEKHGKGEALARKAKKKGKCPMRTVTETAVKVYRAIRDTVPLLMR
ncbi:unnamed protein product [Amoebophrya sp. A120]|nr:unnamed protein product [Amoebophrya sp. A120]|eukprot:GSA120T00021514001.1